ncbi:MAG: HD domain-containing protein [Candidatus Pacebacteria bacterium]|nr:HD domain-containing protein [Candidatus Paceibacterota bacterium]
MSQVVSKIAKIVEDTCKSENNIYGFSAWTHHIQSVVAFSKKLAKKKQADVEVAVLAALLHDYAQISDSKLYSEHHVHSARLARELLENYKYPEQKISQVEHCILSHRGSREIPRETIEAEILASADSMAHFDNLDALFSLAFKVKKWKQAKAESL